ncbi:MAG: SDR family NAD(P)-dependent oxidoreductase [Nocardioides sp.]|nr:SDR family NAD(P)-dependent oxidoreductase [Nocardioides sp.]
MSRSALSTLGHALGRGADLALDRTVAPGYSRLGIGLRRRLPGWPADPGAGSLAGRHVVVTGASSGLGTATAEGLAALGATVHLVVRDLEKGARVRDELAARRAGATYHLWRCDVGDLDDVRRFAAEILAEVPRLDAVVHNAGVMPPERTTSAQGHELSMAVHVLGPALMTELLLPALRAGRTEGGTSRVVLVTSGGMYSQALPADDLEYERGAYSPSTAYARSKRVQVEMLEPLAERWRAAGLEVHATHPGWADTPGVAESLPGFQRVTRPVLRDAVQGADTTVWLVAHATPLPSGRLWHDRRRRPAHLLRRTVPTPAQVEQTWSWVRTAAQLEG